MTWRVLAASWGVLGASRAHLGASEAFALGRHGGVLSRHGDIESSLACPAPSWGAREPRKPRNARDARVPVMHLYNRYTVYIYTQSIVQLYHGAMVHPARTIAYSALGVMETTQLFTLLDLPVSCISLLLFLESKSS